MVAERTDDYFRFKAEIMTRVKGILSPEQMRYFSEVLDKEAENKSFHYKKKVG